MTRSEKWVYIVGSLLGGLDDAGMLRWFAMYEDLDAMFIQAVKLRDGMTVT